MNAPNLAKNNRTMCVDDNVQIDLLEGDLIANNFSTPW
jgi:hypothetical protein